MTLEIPVGPTTTLPKAGERWQHVITKGVYVIVGIALRKDDDTGGAPTVVYRSLYDEHLYVRSVEHFLHHFSILEAVDTVTREAEESVVQQNVWLRD